MTLSWKKSPKVMLLLVFILVYGFSIVIFFVTSRYRLPVVPIMIIFASFALVYLFENISKRTILWKSVSILVFAICLVDIDIFHFRPGPQELAASEAESWYYLGRAEGDKARSEKCGGTKIEAYKKAIMTMQKSIAIDSSFSYPLTFIGIYKIEIAKNLVRTLEADTTISKKKKISIVDDALQNLDNAEKIFQLAHHVEPQFTSPLYNLCLALYFSNILDFTFHGEHNEAVKMNIIKRCDEIEIITDKLLQRKNLYKHKKYNELRRKARMQKKAVLGT